MDIDYVFFVLLFFSFLLDNIIHTTDIELQISYPKCVANYSTHTLYAHHNMTRVEATTT